MTTACDSYYQTTNNRNKRKNNPKVLINTDKLKICFTADSTCISAFNLKRIPSSADKQRNKEPFSQMMNLKTNS